MRRQQIDRIERVCILVLGLVVTAFSAAFRGNIVVARSLQPVPSATPSYSGYRGVQIGTAIDDARKLLGSPKEKSDSQDYYVFSDKESAQIMYGPDHKVTTISVTYVGKESSIPTPKEIFGEDAEIKSDGSISKMVRYPKIGYWLSYNRTAGDEPIVIVTAQKMNGSPEN